MDKEEAVRLIRSLPAYNLDVKQIGYEERRKKISEQEQRAIINLIESQAAEIAELKERNETLFLNNENYRNVERPRYERQLTDLNNDTAELNSTIWSKQDEIKELKATGIFPRFKVGQECWFYDLFSVSEPEQQRVDHFYYSSETKRFHYILNATGYREASERSLFSSREEAIAEMKSDEELHAAGSTAPADLKEGE